MSEERRSAALHLWPHLEAVPDTVARGLSPRLPRHQPRRFAEALAVKAGGLCWERNVVKPLMRFRRDALGPDAAGPPRVLVRVDEFPNAGGFDPAGELGTEAFRRFHAVLTEAGVPYLLAITPNVSRDYLDPEQAERRSIEDSELAAIAELDREGVVFALHGADHRTRHPHPRHHSEFCGLSPAQAAARIDEARGAFDRAGIKTPVFVPPFNRFDAAQYPLLAERFEVVCGGPESVRLLGFQPTPTWQGEAVYLPSYRPLYGTAAGTIGEVERLLELEAGLWAPLTLHWGWELRDDFAALRRLCQRLQGIATDWTEFLTAVAATR